MIIVGNLKIANCNVKKPYVPQNNILVVLHDDITHDIINMKFTKMNGREIH